MPQKKPRHIAGLLYFQNFIDLVQSVLGSLVRSVFQHHRLWLSLKHHFLTRERIDSFASWAGWFGLLGEDAKRSCDLIILDKRVLESFECSFGLLFGDAGCLSDGGRCLGLGEGFSHEIKGLSD